jgi:hypothetical protein
MTRTTDDVDIDNLSPVVPTPRADGYENPFELVDSPMGLMERWRANAMAIGVTGGMSALHEMRFESATRENNLTRWIACGLTFLLLSICRDLSRLETTRSLAGVHAWQQNVVWPRSKQL